MKAEGKSITQDVVDQETLSKKDGVSGSMKSETCQSRNPEITGDVSTGNLRKTISNKDDIGQGISSADPAIVKYKVSDNNSMKSEGSDFEHVGAKQIPDNNLKPSDCQLKGNLPSHDDKHLKKSMECLNLSKLESDSMANNVGNGNLKTVTSQKEVGSIDWNDLIDAEESENLSAGQQIRQVPKRQSRPQKELQKQEKTEPNKGKSEDSKSENIVKRKEAKQKEEEQAVIEAIKKAEKDEKHVQIVVKEDFAVERSDTNYYSHHREMKRQKSR